MLFLFAEEFQSDSRMNEQIILRWALLVFKMQYDISLQQDFSLMQQSFVDQARKKLASLSEILGSLNNVNYQSENDKQLNEVIANYRRLKQISLKFMDSKRQITLQERIPIDTNAHQKVDIQTKWGRKFMVEGNSISSMNFPTESEWTQILLKVRIIEDFTFFADIVRGGKVMVGVVDRICSNNQSSFQTGISIAYNCLNGQIFYPDENSNILTVRTLDRVRKGMCLKMVVRRKHKTVTFQVKDCEAFKGRDITVQSLFIGSKCELVPYFQMMENTQIKWGILNDSQN